MDIVLSLDTVWVLLSAILVFIMQAGFSLLEIGLIRSKNSANVLMKNFFDFSIGTLMFWAVGFGIMFGSGKFFGEIDFMGTAGWSGTVPSTAFLIFQTMFCATSATIVSGAVAERTKFSAYFIFTLVIVTVIYPISGHWAWGGGWLAELGFNDFAGSAVVHSVGGWLALIGAWTVGPRIGKYRKDKDGKIKVCAIPGHNITIAALGVFLLWFGWFGFNPGSQLGAAGETSRFLISNTFLTTNIAAAAGCITILLVSWVKYGKPTLSLSLNGALAGLVGVTAGCNLVAPEGALAIGVISSLVMLFAVEFFDKTLKIDDPVGAISVHGVCGTLGTILTGLFATEKGLLYCGDASFLGIQALGAATYMIWALAAGFILFKGLDKIKGLRVSKRVEEEGIDIYEHGENAYSN